MKRISALCLAIGMVTTTLAQEAKHRSFIEFNGVDQYLSIPSHPDFDIPLGKSYTITCWFWGERSMIYGDAMRLVSRRDAGKLDTLNCSGYDLLALKTTSWGFAGASLPNGAGTYTNSLDKFTAGRGDEELRQWHHLALVVDRLNAKISLYIDGDLKLVADKDIRSWLAVNNLPLFIGAGQHGEKPFAHFHGRIDNVRFYKSALTLSEVVTDRDTESMISYREDLVAAFDFDTYHPGDTFVEDATRRHTAILHGFPKAQMHHVIRTYTDQRTNGNLIGRGDAQALRVLTLGLTAPQTLESVEVLTPEVHYPRDIKRLNLYLTDNGDRFDHRHPGTLLASARPSVGSTILKATKNIKINQHSKLWLVADVADNATEGHTITTSIKRIKLSNTLVFLPESKTEEHEIVLRRTLLWTPTENHSAHYRIPGLIRLDNGNLVASIDKRKNTDYDLPSDINVEVKISRDNGKTWSKPITVAEGTPTHGYGDAAMATDGKNIYMVMVAGSGLWQYPANASKPLEMYYSQSLDGGLTWTPVREITNEVYTDRFPNGGFFGSGNGIVTSTGRIAFVAALRTDARAGGNMDNVMVYSDDQGKTWHRSPIARVNGDEAKIVELSNGDLLISSRNRAWRPTPRTYVISKDNGHTWSAPATWNELVGNACNTALTRYSSTRSGEPNVLLHTLIESEKRDNLRIYVSEDEGKTWHVGNTICVGEAAYSEVTRLKDGTIGIISEENDRPAYDIYFTQVSLDWIKKGKPARKFNE